MTRGEFRDKIARRKATTEPDVVAPNTSRREIAARARGRSAAAVYPVGRFRRSPGVGRLTFNVAIATRGMSSALCQESRERPHTW